MVKRYAVSGFWELTGEPVPGNTVMVSMADYDALAARLAEDERLLMDIRGQTIDAWDAQHVWLSRIDAVLTGATVSAPAVCSHGIRLPHECRECADSTPQSVANEWLKREMATGSADVARPEPCNHGKRQPNCPNCQAEIAALTVTGTP